jgi:hypothetical protein
MEMVVAAAIFATASLMLTNVYILSQKAQVKLTGQTKIQADSRFIMEVMTREIRQSQVDYDYINNLTGLPIGSSGNFELNYLPLKDVQGNTVVFAESGNPAVCPPKSSTCLAVKKNNSAWASITPDSVEVIRADFYIQPLSDPFLLDVGAGAYSADGQPSVTIVLVTKNITDRAGDTQTNYLQTTVSSRVYKRYE